jgi:hypothetical protein
MAGQTDKFGIPMWYATKSGGFFYESSDDPANDDAFEGGSETKTTGTNTVTMKPNGPTNFHLGKNVKGFKDSIGGCKLKFPEAAARGYAYKKDDVRDMEIKGVFKFNIGSNGFSISCCTGHHSGSKCCQGHAYMITLEPSDNPYSATFRKEMWHVSYHPSPEGSFNIPGISNDNVWFGFGLVRYNKKVSDDPTEDQVVLECWANVHPDSDIKDWKMIKKIVDKSGNGWGNDGNVCGGDKDQVITWSGPKNRFKTNANSGTVQAKMLSLREIDPLGTIGGGDGGGGGGIPPEPPKPPTTGTIFRDWVMPYNIITFPDDACGSGDDTSTITPFYNVIDNGSSSNLHRDRYRVCMVANGSASKFVGKKPRRVRMWLSCTGSPPDGEITVALRKNNTDEVAVSFALTAVDGVPTPPPLNALALSDTKKQYTFENLTSAYIWQVGDRICVEYSGNTADTENDINVFRSTDNPYDGTNSCAIKFDAGGPPPTGYTAPDTSRDYAWEISEISDASSTP